MTHKNEFLRFMLNALNGVNHAHVFAHLESSLSNLQLHILEALLSKCFKEYLRIPQTSLCYFNASVVSMNGKILKEESQMAFVSILQPSPAVNVRVSSQVLPSNSISSSMRVKESSLQDDWLQIFVEESDDTGFVFVYFIELQILRQMNNLGSFQ